MALNTTTTTCCKRRRNETEEHILPTAEAYNKFYVLQSQVSDKPLSKLSPFIIEKCIQANLGTVDKVSKMQSGCLLIELNRPSQVKSIEALKNFFNIPILVSVHRSLNTCRGVVFSRELAALEDSEITDELKNQNVVSSYTMKKQGSKLNTIILTFKGKNIPTHIKAGYMRIAVKPYIPSPRRCFKCQKLGHLQSHCRSIPRCATCGQAAHQENSRACTETPKCVNCNENHPSFSKLCPKFIQEKNILKMSVENNLTYREAKKLTMEENTNLPVSYAKKASNHKDQAVQTEIPDCTCGALMPLQKLTSGKTTGTQTDMPYESQTCTAIASSQATLKMAHSPIRSPQHPRRKLSLGESETFHIQRGRSRDKNAPPIRDYSRQRNGCNSKSKLDKQSDGGKGPPMQLSQ